MGKTAPKGYLACDGTEYNIADYKKLADFIKEQFGTVNNFGGDGETTFAVPNLQGEFLRGSGTNRYMNQGNGGEVGEHQDATRHINLSQTSSSMYYDEAQGDGLTSVSNQDSLIHRGGSQKYETTLTTHVTNSASWINERSCSNFTSRPTNTSVIYCIKY